MKRKATNVWRWQWWRNPNIVFLKFIQTTKLLWLDAYTPNNMQRRWLWMPTWLPRKSMFQFWKLQLEFNLYIYDLKHLNLKIIIIILIIFLEFFVKLFEFEKKIWKLIFQFWKLLFQFLKTLFEFLKILFKFLKIIWFKFWYLNSKLLISILSFLILI
jgi:hypothetical protein